MRKTSRLLPTSLVAHHDHRPYVAAAAANNVTIVFTLKKINHIYSVAHFQRQKFSMRQKYRITFFFNGKTAASHDTWAMFPLEVAIPPKNSQNTNSAQTCFEQQIPKKKTKLEEKQRAAPADTAHQHQ